MLPQVKAATKKKAKVNIQEVVEKIHNKTCESHDHM